MITINARTETYVDTIAAKVVESHELQQSNRDGWTASVRMAMDLLRGPDMKRFRKKKEKIDEDVKSDLEEARKGYEKQRKKLIDEAKEQDDDDIMKALRQLDEEYRRTEAMVRQRQIEEYRSAIWTILTRNGTGRKRKKTKKGRRR